MPDPWMRWGIDVVQFAQAHNSPIIDSIFHVITYLGYEEFYLLLIPLIYWCLDKRTGIRLTALLLLSVYVNFILKDSLGWPRPPADQVRQVIDEGYSGMPSGHAQNSVVVFGYLASAGVSGWAIAGLLAFLVGVSRIFLGVHFPQDVLGGWVLGIIMLGIALLLLKQLDAVRIPSWAMWGAAIVTPIALTFAYTTPESVQVMGALLGLGAGYLLERHFIGFEPQATWRRQIAKFLVGAVMLVALWAGLKELLPAGPVFRFLRYTLVGLWGTFLAPWVFVRTGWASTIPRPADRGSLRRG